MPTYKTLHCVRTAWALCVHCVHGIPRLFFRTMAPSYQGGASQIQTFSCVSPIAEKNIRATIQCTPKGGQRQQYEANPQIALQSLLWRPELTDGYHKSALPTMEWRA